jgi:hypothetical protein
MDCLVDDCGNRATLRYTWAWGEEGECCNEHRSHLESKSAQLGRAISFVELSDTDRPPPRRPYSAPGLRRLDAGPIEKALHREIEKRDEIIDHQNATIAALEAAQTKLAAEVKRLELALAADPPELRAELAARGEPADVEREAPTRVE